MTVLLRDGNARGFSRSVFRICNLHFINMFYAATTMPAIGSQPALALAPPRLWLHLHFHPQLQLPLLALILILLRHVGNFKCVSS